MKENQASSTAYSVVQGVVLTARDPELGQLVSPEHEAACLAILKGSEEGKRRLKHIRNPLSRWLGRAIEGLIIPGFTLHYVLRKRFIEKEARKAIAAGACQLVNIGAGFDSLALRLARDFPDVTFIEIDHPATSLAKQAALGETGLPNYVMLAEDLSLRGMDEVLQESGVFRDGVKTIYVCEGVMMYLPLAAVQGIFASIREMSGAGSRLVFTVVTPVGSEDDNTSRLLQFYLKLKNEPLAWTALRREMKAFVATQGFALRHVKNDLDLIAEFYPSHYAGPLHTSEFAVSVEAL